MKALRSACRRTGKLFFSYLRDSRATSAVEFAIISMPFFLLLLCTLQIGVYFIAQSALNAGVLETAQSLSTGFHTGTTANLPSAGTLKSEVVALAGAMISNDSTLAVEIQPIDNLSAASVPITDGLVNYGTTTSTLMLRAQATVVTFAPGFNALTVATASAIVRRAGT